MLKAAKGSANKVTRISPVLVGGFIVFFARFKPGILYENETFGASFCSGLSITNNSAAAKLNVLAIRLLGNTSRSVL
jgi:hypothetical protein